MMRRAAGRRGILSLSMTLALVGLLFVLQMLMLQQTDNARRAVLRDRNREAARNLALDGIEYARHQVASGHWAREPRRWMSPSLDGHGRFELEVVRANGRPVVRSTGIVEDASVAEHRTEEAALP